MTLTLTESQAINEIAKLLYDFLPGKPHPYADQHISFAGAANDLGLSNFWSGGSKLPATTMLLAKTLELRRDYFCKLVLEIVRRGMIYRGNKNNPISREEIKRLNQLIERVKFKIPELWDPNFLSSLPSTEPELPQAITAVSQAGLDQLKQRFTELELMQPQARGFAFEKFLRDLFSLFGLAPHASFRLVGEQIDGSFQLDNDTYLVEAKWQKEQAGNAELLIFRGKVEGKATWSRGLIISYSGFSEDGLTAFSRGRPTNIIAMTGQDLYFILDGKLSLIDALRLKARRAAETGQALVTVYELSLGG
jgi:hypothetical protein